MFTRRRLLLSAATVSALATVGGWAAFDLPDPAPGRYVLSEAELILVQALAEALFAPGNPLGVTAVGMDLAPLVDEIIGDRLDPLVTPLFRQTLNAMNEATRVSRGAPFVALSLEERVAVMDTWAEPGVLPRRLAYDALRTVVGMAFFVQPEVNAVIGWRAHCEPVRT